MRLLVVVLCAGCGRIDFAIDGSATSGFAIPTLVHAANGQTSAHVSELVVTTPASSAGDTLVVTVAGFSPVTMVTDSAGDAYVSANVRATDVNTNDTEIFFARAGVDVVSVTVDTSTSNSIAVWVLELDGIAPQASIETTNSASNGNAPIAMGPSVTTTTPNSVIVAVVGTSTSLTQLHAGSTFIDLPMQQGTFSAYDIATVPGTYAASWDVNGTSPSAVSTAVFAPAPL